MTPSVRRRRFGALLAWVLALASAPASAQVREVRLALDNDAYDFWVPISERADNDYTNGIDLSVELAGGPLWSAVLAPHAPACVAAVPSNVSCTTTTLTLGQKIFTPAITGPAPIDGQRPYAGWLYLGARAGIQSAARLRSVGLDVGVTGGPSLGKTVQTAWHDLLGIYDPEGWDQQLAFEPAFRLSYDESRILVDAGAKGTRIATIAPAWGADVGTMHAGAYAGLSARAGWSVPHPWSAAADRGAHPMSLYGLARVRESIVARDLFLDGSTFRSSVRVDRRPFVWEYELGAGTRIGPLTLEYRALTRAREYETQPGPHSWGTLEARLRLR
jgi:hypothetical protein